MKNLGKVLVVAAAVLAVLAVYSRMTLTPLSGIEARALVGGAGLLLLFAIALK
ncbi:hypothetical protein ACFLZ3_04105 [Candidatus Omnitrophota bacterium]